MSVSQDVSVQPSPRNFLELRKGWQFSFGSTGETPASEYGDQEWQDVEVPHSWNVCDATCHEGYRRGVGMYRLHFDAPPNGGGHRMYLEFDGANLVATVWLNGQILGSHYGGYSRFRFDVTSIIKPGVRNELRVNVDNSPRGDVPPLQGDFTMFGGLYRSVRLIRAADLSIDLMDHAGPGVYLTSAIEGNRAELTAQIRLANATGVARRARVTVRVWGPKGTLETEQSIEHLATMGVSDVSLTLTVRNPHLWEGLADPALYRVCTEVYEAGTLRDAHTEAFGFRTFAVDPERGFSLNGNRYPLRGVCLHQDREERGWVEEREGLEQDFEMLGELGANFVRVVHYQSHPYLYELCDRLGYVIWAEQALIDRADPSPVFSERTLLQMTELIRQNYNRPSIAFWGISNELRTADMPEAKALLKQLATLCRREDPARFSTLATNYAEPSGTYGEDVTAYNNYLGWYGGTFADFPRWLDEQRAKNPTVPMGISEYGAGAGASIHYDHPRMMDHSEEYQCLYHESAWRALAARPWLFCTAIWVMYDYASAQRAEGQSLGINDKGLVSRDRKVKKDAFYFYKAQWSEKPFVYIASRRFMARTEAMTEVKVYSNQSAVELLHNGQSLGMRSVDHGIATWDDVQLTPWANRLEAKAVDVVDAVDWILNVYYNPWV